MIFLFIALPLVVAGLLPLIGKISKKVLPDILANGVFLVLLGYAVFVGKSLISNGPILQQLIWLGEPVNIHMALDGFSLFMLFTVSLVSLCVGLYSINYMEHYGDKATYYALLLIMLAGMNGLVLVTDLFQVYLFLEMAAIASYALVAYGLGHDELEASFKYLMLSAVASGFIVLSITVLFGLTGGLSFESVAAGLRSLDAKYPVGICAAFFIFGFGLKAALIPFHAWLPDAHPSAPAPISAMLSGVVIKVSGIYALVRVLYTVFGLTPMVVQVLMALGVLSMVAGALLALGQTDFKRMLAYSSISQIGYIVVGFALGTPLGIMGGLFHLFNHATFKGLLFLDAGATEYATGTRDLTKLGGINNKLPITGLTTTIGTFSIAGVPPFNGFWSKLLIIVALVETQHYLVATIAIATSVLTLWYFLLMQRRAFYGKLAASLEKIKEVPFAMGLAVFCLAAICLLVGVFYPAVVDRLIQPGVAALTNVLGTGTVPIY